MIKITIAICTWNRSNLLDQALQKLTELIIPENISLEIIVVNNNCTDDTPKIINSFEKKLPIKQVFEPKPGLSNARNKAVKEATGEYIIWTDDDTLVDKNWIQAYSTFFIDNPDIIVFGGPVIPYYECPPPMWLKNGINIVADAFALRNLGNKPIPFTPYTECLPFGANYAIRLDIQKQYSYSPDLGRQPNNINLLGEETQVINKILEKGNKSLWVPSAIVKHRIPANRQTLKYIYDYYIGKGISIGYTLNNDKLFLGKPIWLLLKILKLQFKYLFHKTFYSETIWLQTLKQKCLNQGFLQSIK
jgi:glycosyltransferase involved in cell wall biosynthesis